MGPWGRPVRQRLSSMLSQIDSGIYTYGYNLCVRCSYCSLYCCAFRYSTLKMGVRAESRHAASVHYVHMHYRLYHATPMPRGHLSDRNSCRGGLLRRSVWVPKSKVPVPRTALPAGKFEPGSSLPSDTRQLSAPSPTHAHRPIMRVIHAVPPSSPSP